MSSPACQQCGQPITGNTPGDGLCASCVWVMLHDPAYAPTVALPVNGMPVIPGHEIVEELARGGMGVVYRARQTEPQREVALKMLLPFESERRDVRDRFQVEITALADLDHPGILPLYQVGETAGRPWFTMKLAAGGSLASRLKRKRKPSDPAGAAKLMAAMADAVHHAHAHGVLHRDIKPGNILFDERGEAFLADFGIAKLLDSTADMTHTAAVLGTPCYMAPEVASQGAKSATIASDIYGLGAVLYELLSGRPPFMVEGMAALVKKIIEDEPERPSTIADHVPRDLELVCLTCLAKDPRQRYATAANVAEDLRRWGSGEPVAARRAGAVARLWAWSRRRPALAAVSAALIVTVLTASVWLAIANHQLSSALTDARESRHRADLQSEFLIGEFADSLEKMGKLELIETACAEAEKLDQPIDDAGRKRRARLLYRWASANWTGGDGTRAAPRLREVIESMDALFAREPRDAKSFTLGLEARCLLAEVLADISSFADALALMDQADEAISSHGILPLDHALGLQAEVDRTRALLWNRHRRTEPEATLAAAARAAASFRAWQSRAADERERTLALAAALREAGKTWYYSSGEHPDPPGLEKALPLFTEGAGLMRALPNRTPAEDFELALSTGWMGDCFLRLEGKGPDAAEPLHREEYRIVSALVARDPLNGEWQHQLANSHLSLAELSRDLGKPNEAEEHWTACRAILKELHENAPLVRSWALNYLSALRRDGHRALRNENPTAAAPLLEQCAALAATRVAAMPDSTTEREGWKDTTNEAAGLLAKHQEIPRALTIFRNAAAIAEKAAATPGPGQAWWQWTLLSYQRKVAASSRDAAALEKWLAANLPALEQRAAEAGTRAAVTPASLSECEVWKGLTDELGKTLEDQKDWLRALIVYRSARLLAEKTAPVAGAGQLWWEWTLAHYHRRVAAASKQTGALPDWLAENLPALEIRIRHLRTGSPFARRNPEAVANAFQVTIEAQLANQQPAAALAAGTRCLDLYLECQATAGPAWEWAAPIVKAAAAGIATNESLAGHALATRAASALYPRAGRNHLTENDRAAASSLDQLAPPPAP